MPATNQDPGNCQCSGPPSCASPTIVGKVTGCNSLNLSGATVEAHDATSGGTLLGSTTTNSSGNYTLSGLVGAVSGNAIVVVISKARFTPAVTRTLSYTAGSPSNSQWSCGATTPTATRALAADTATYLCINGCADPIKRVLTASYGGTTLTYDAGVSAYWGTTTATVTKMSSITYPGGLNCICNTASGSINVTIRFLPNSGTDGELQVVYSLCRDTACSPTINWYLDQSAAYSPTAVNPTTDPTCVASRVVQVGTGSTSGNATTKTCPTTAYQFTGSITNLGTGDARDAPFTGAVTVTE